NIVSQALELNPAIVLKTFGWKYDTTDIVGAAEGPNSPSVDKSSPSSPLAAVRHQSGLIQGEVQPFRGDYRAAIETINRFVEALSQQPEVAAVKIIRLPLNINPDLSLSGTTQNSGDGEQAGKAEFRLLVMLKQTI